MCKQFWQIHEMIEWMIHNVCEKNLEFVFKLMFFLRKNGGIKKMELICDISPRKSKPPSPYPSDSLQISEIVQSPPINFFLKKIAPLPSPLIQKGGGGTDNKAQCCTQRFLHTLVYVHLLCTCVEPKNTWLRLILENLLEITIARFA